jgi:hypothetical protein
LSHPLTGTQSTMSVAAYFELRYPQVKLRFPHYPCVEVGASGTSVKMAGQLIATKYSAIFEQTIIVSQTQAA